jgi:hypothetical protein
MDRWLIELTHHAALLARACALIPPSPTQLSSPTGQPPMPLPNRINPWGQFVATPERGTRMGNRGILHALATHEGVTDGAAPVLQRLWQHQAWVCCLTEFNGRQRAKPWSTPNNYSELFFLDEATALAAGHRPCFQCQHERASAFKRAWLAAHAPGRSVSAGEMNAQLHAERVRRGGGRSAGRAEGHANGGDGLGSELAPGVQLGAEQGLAPVTKPVDTAQLGDLPVGTLFALGATAAVGDAVWLRAAHGCLPWSFAGYGPAQPWAADTPVTVLTPPSIVAVLRAGYVPDVHESARQA